MAPPCPGRGTISHICPRSRETSLIFPITPNFAVLQSKLELLHYMALCVKYQHQVHKNQIQVIQTCRPLNSRCSMNPSPDKRVQPRPFLKTKSFLCPPCIASGVATEGAVVYVPPSQYFNLLVCFEGLTSVN